MRIWTVHPKYLDVKGLLAAWREGLLAQKVLLGETRGYRNHPQLKRFQARKDPVSAIASYLHLVCDEATARGYHFDRTRVVTERKRLLINCTRGQLLYEWSHLKRKLKLRDPRKYFELSKVREPAVNPLFR